MDEEKCNYPGRDVRQPNGINILRVEIKPEIRYPGTRTRTRALGSEVN